MKLEVAVTSCAGVRDSANRGAQRVELTTALEVGGLTPSIGLLAQSKVEAPELEIHTLIRTRPGDFVYSADELEVMARDIRQCLREGADGVVLGALSVDGAVDEPAVRRLIEAAKDADPTAEITFHRAMDHSRDIRQSLDVLLSLGVDRVLTSGHAASVGEGIDALEAMARHVAGRLQIMAGGGLRIQDIEPLYQRGLAAVHLSAKAHFAGRSLGTVPMGSSDAANPNAYWVTDAPVITQARAEIDRLLEDFPRDSGE